MRRGLFGVIVVLGLSVMVGCGPSLKEYVSKSGSYSNQVSAARNATVEIEPNGVVDAHGMGKTIGTLGAIVNTASSVAAMALSSDQSARMNRLINSNEVALAVSDGFNQSFAGTTHLQVIDDGSVPDLRIVLSVNEYGLWAESLMSPMNFYVEADIRVIYTPEMETIYSNGATLMHSASDIISEMANAASMEIYMSGHLTRREYATFSAINNVGHLAKGAANLSAFFKLTDEEIVAIFDYLAFDAGSTIGSQLVDAIYR